METDKELSKKREKSRALIAKNRISVAKGPFSVCNNVKVWSINQMCPHFYGLAIKSTETKQF